MKSFAFLRCWGRPLVANRHRARAGGQWSWVLSGYRMPHCPLRRRLQRVSRIRLSLKRRRGGTRSSGAYSNSALLEQRQSFLGGLLRGNAKFPPGLLCQGRIPRGAPAAADRVQVDGHERQCRGETSVKNRQGQSKQASKTPCPPKMQVVPCNRRLKGFGSHIAWPRCD
jgi:hypothetical protein